MILLIFMIYIILSAEDFIEPAYDKHLISICYGFIKDKDEDRQRPVQKAI